MKKISRELRDQAKQLLPDENFKQSLKDQILPSYETEQKKSVAANKKSVLIKSLASAAAVLVVIIALVIGFTVPAMQPGSVGGETVVLIDINPSFEIVADEKDIVKQVTGLNSDARIVLLGKNYTGKDLYEVCNDIVLTAIHLNYVDAVTDIINIIAYNQNADSESLTISKIKDMVENSVGGSAQLVISNSDEAKQQLIDEIVLQYGDMGGLTNKTIAELHRILMAYDITKEEELDELEDLWEEELEKAGFDDDIAEDIIDKWKEENLKPLGESLEDEIEDYLEIFELKLIKNNNLSEEEAERQTKAEHRRIMSMGNRMNIRKFIDEWWIEAEKEFFELKQAEWLKAGYTQEEIDEKISKIKEEFAKDTEDKKEIIADYLEEYYEED